MPHGRSGSAAAGCAGCRVPGDAPPRHSSRHLPTRPSLAGLPGRARLVRPPRARPVRRRRPGPCGAARRSRVRPRLTPRGWLLGLAPDSAGRLRGAGRSRSRGGTGASAWAVTVRRAAAVGSVVGRLVSTRWVHVTTVTAVLFEGDWDCWRANTVWRSWSRYGAVCGASSIPAFPFGSICLMARRVAAHGHL